MNDEICKVFAECIFEIHNMDEVTGVVNQEGSYPPYEGVVEGIHEDMDMMLTTFYLGRVGKFPFSTETTSGDCLNYFKQWYKNAYNNGDLV